MAEHICGTTAAGNEDEWTEDGEDYNPLYFDCEVALRQYTLEADAYGDIEFYFYRSHPTYDAEDGWPVVYSDSCGKPGTLLVNLNKQRVGLTSGETKHWAHCTLTLNRSLKKNEKVWIGIWTFFYTSTFTRLSKSTYAATDYIWNYSLGYYKDDLEDPPPEQAPTQWTKDDWRPAALLPHYFVYSDQPPRTDYAITIADGIALTGAFRRYSGKFLKQVTDRACMREDAIPMRKLFMSKTTPLVIQTAVKHVRGKTVSVMTKFTLGGSVTPSRMIRRCIDHVLTFWEKLKGRAIANRLEAEFWSPVTTELSLMSKIQDDDT